MRKLHLKIKSSYLSIFCVLLLCFPAFGSTPRIRVKIASNLEQLAISGKNLVKKDLLSNHIQKFKGNRQIYFNCRSEQNPSSLSSPVLVASLSTTSGLVDWNSAQYKGDIIVATNPQRTGCDLINELSIDDYIASLLANEMNPAWHLEALKAQAVAARTYAVQKIRSQSISKRVNLDLPYDIINSERYQVSGGFHDATARTIQAAQETSGEILVTRKTGKIIPIFYHADCVGKTFLPAEIWGVRYPAYRSVTCNYPKTKKIKRWSIAVSTHQFLRFINWYKRVNRINIKEKRIRIYSDRLPRSYLRLYFGTQVFLVPKSQLRRFFGHKKIPSTRFLLKRVGRFYKIVGVGRGHGVGMSQIGALYMARAGMNYRQILHHYYPGFKIKEIY